MTTDAPTRPATSEPPDAQVASWLARLETALGAGDAPGATALFGDECFWRDLIAFTWNIVTLEGRAAISGMLEATLARVQPRNFAVEGKVVVNGDVIEAGFCFATSVARGYGRVRLRDGQGWTLLTAAMALTGFEEATGATRARGTDHGVVRGRQSWLERRQSESAALGATEQPFCLIVGGGQGGLGLAARLKRQGVPTLVVERLARSGDTWRSRYRSLCLHDPVWYDHMPYLPFPEHWPVFMPKDQIGDWLEMYARVMELDVWNSTSCTAARFDAERQEWHVTVSREGVETMLRPKHLVLALGLAGRPQVPDVPGADSFAGTQMHSSQYGSGADWAGKHCVVIGSNNSAHDICADLWEHGAEVTMVQRSSTLVVRSETLMQASWGTLYSQAAQDSGITTDLADLTAASMPYRLLPRFQIPLWARIRAQDAAFYDRLQAAGFMLDFGEDESGLSLKFLRRGSGYYIDVGASELIADGRIRLRSRVGVRALVPDGVVLTDGTMLAADLVVYATGYGSMTGWAEQLISPDVAEAVGPCWGLGSGTTLDPGPWAGELRNMWKPTAQPGLWFHGGNLAQSRHYSRYVALQLKARLEGIATPVYPG